MTTMQTRQVVVPAPMILVGHVVDNTSDSGDLEVLSVEPWCELGKITYKVVIGRNGQKVMTCELLEQHNLTYTYAVKE